VKAACAFAIGVLWIPHACAQQSKTVHTDDSFNGRQVELRTGETLAVTLSENASTGFRWTIPPEVARKFEKVLREKETSVEGTPNPPGSRGVRHFYFEVLEPGTADLELQYRRPWETGKAPARKFKLHVDVRPAAEP